MPLVRQSFAYIAYMKKQIFVKYKVSSIHNLANIRLESVPAGESWSVEKTGSAMTISSQIAHSVEFQC